MLIKVDAIRQSRRYTNVTENGLAIGSGLPLPIGASVEVIILDNGVPNSVAPRNENRLSLANDVLVENKSFDPSSPEYLVSISSLMTEWESAADESAYQDL
jgi:hypothetical protein